MEFTLIFKNLASLKKKKKSCTSYPFSKFQYFYIVLKFYNNFRFMQELQRQQDKPFLVSTYHITII